MFETAKYRIWGVLVGITLLVSACGASAGEEATISTAVAQTIQAGDSLTAVASLPTSPSLPLAAYPCQRAAFPLASSFMIWLTALLGSAFAWRKFRQWDARLWQVCMWGAAALALAALVVTGLPSVRAWAGNPPHGMVGVAKGIFPGRVVWVHAPGSDELVRLHFSRALVRDESHGPGGSRGDDVQGRAGGGRGQRPKSYCHHRALPPGDWQ